MCLLIIFHLFLCYVLSVLSLDVKPVAVKESLDLSEWERIFAERSDEEWKNLWHIEKHKRCFQELENHMEWVCDKDIYKMGKRSIVSYEDREKLFLEPKKALNILTSSSVSPKQKRGITEECCEGIEGCSWEEYAEYCLLNNRVRFK